MIPFPVPAQAAAGPYRSLGARAGSSSSAAGSAACRRRRRSADAPVHVTLVDRRNHHLFQPLLYQVATAALSPADIARRSARSCAASRTCDVRAGRGRRDRCRGEGDRPRRGRRRLPVRLPDPRRRRAPRLLRPRRVGALRAGPEDARGRARDPPPHPARVRGGRARARSGAAQGAADVRRRRRRPDRRRAGRRDRRDRAATRWRATSATSTRATRASSCSRPDRGSSPPFPTGSPGEALRRPRAARRRGAHRHSPSRASTPDAVTVGDEIIPANTSSGPRACRVAAGPLARRAARPRRPRHRRARPDGARPSRGVRHRRPGLARRTPRAGRCPAWRRWRCSRAACGGGEHPARDRGRAGAALPLPRPRQPGDHRPQCGRGRHRGLRSPASSPGSSGCSSTSST